MRRGPLSRIGDVLAGGLFVAFGLAFAVLVASGILDNIRLRLQPPIDFEVVRTEILPADLGRGGFNLVVHFQQPGRSEQMWTELHGWDYRDLARTQRTLPPGTRVVGRRYPAVSPERLDLVEPGWRSLFALPLVAFPLGFVGVGGWIAWGGITGRERPTGNRTKDTPTWIPLVAGTVLLLVGFAPILGVGVLPVWHWSRSRDWAPTPATIEMSKSVVTSSGKGGRSWHPEVLYRYAWKGETHRSSDIGPGRKDSESSTSRFVREHPPGSKTTCLVNPIDPTEAFLDRSLSWWSLLALPFLLFPAVGIFLLRLGWRNLRKSRTGLRERAAPGRFGLRWM
jgi:hypothetical protein